MSARDTIRAFPGVAVEDIYGGMGLRDWFAGQAPQGMASILADDGDMIMGWADMAKAAYVVADAMMAERAKGDSK